MDSTSGGCSAAANCPGDDLLPADKAFVLAATSDSPDRVTLHWEIADGYYLYRDKVKVAATSGNAQLGRDLDSRRQG